MTEPTTQTPAPRFPTSRSYAAAAAACVVFVVYGSLLPFELHLRSIDSAWDAFQGSLLMPPPRRVSRSDVLANILLFVPVGFTLAGSLLVDRYTLTRAAAAVPAILAMSVAISLLAEFLQTFALGRVPSNLDIAAQTLGCLAGVAAWAIGGSGLTGWIRESLAATGGDRIGRLLAAYGAGWLFVNLAPFDITVDVGDLADRVRDGEIAVVPFGDTWTMEPRRVWDALAETMSGVPLGVLALVGGATRRRRTAAAAVAVGGAAVALVEVAQVFIESHAADVTDAILGTAGVAAGVWLGTRMRRAAGATATDSAAAWWRGAAVFGAWCLVLAVYHWMPYDFAVDEAAIREKLARVSLLPFASYGAGSYLNALNDVLLKIALSMPLGASLAFIIQRTTGPRGVVTAAWLAVSACVFGVIEAGQLFLPTRVPDPTDVLVGVIGMLIGLFAVRWAHPGPHRLSR